MSSSQLPGGTEPHESFYRPFTDLSRDLGLTIKNEWLPVARAADPRRFAHETYGYEQFRELWRQPEHPDGLVVYDDVIARGVILALRENQVRVPAELKLVFSKNEAVDLLCPMPATFLVQSERAVARGLVDQIDKQFRGERCEPIIVPYHLQAHDGTSQPTTNTKG